MATEIIRHPNKLQALEDCNRRVTLGIETLGDGNIGVNIQPDYVEMSYPEMDGSTGVLRFVWGGNGTPWYCDETLCVTSDCCLYGSPDTCEKRKARKNEA